MTRTALAQALALTSAPLPDIDTDLFVVPLFEGESPSGELQAVDEASGGAVGRAIASREIQGRPFEFFLTPSTSGWRAARIAAIGVGKRGEFTTERLRRVATAAGLNARQRRVARIAWLHRGDLDPVAAVQAAAEGLMLAAFSADRYRTGERCNPPAEQLIIAVDASTARPLLNRIEVAVERGRILGECSNISRELCNEPSNVLTPTVFAERASEICGGLGLTIDILGEREIAELGMGLLQGVSRGSSEPPRVIVIRHDPPGAPASPVLGLVGKGVTFDTGGISIKPADGMERMKDDMAGGAAVICAMRAIALLKAPRRVVGIIPATENMPGGRAIKPGDVLTGASGKTVEVINTDAEGRLILGDGLWYAQKLGATHLVDVATLTGACVVALGKAASGIFGQPESWVDTVRRTGQAAGDRCWPMPLYEEYAEQLKSEIADMINSGGRPAGACTAAMFLKEFTNGLPWVHLDVAGTAWAEDSKPWQPKGPSGVAVRTLAELAFLEPGAFEGV
jgi:leucyl aminopeptidase